MAKCFHDIVDFYPEAEAWHCVTCGDEVPEPDYDPEDFNDEEEF